jgi:hypothetical protein
MLVSAIASPARRLEVARAGKAKGMEKKGTGHLGARQVQMISKAIANYKLNAGTDGFKIIRICHKYSE